MDPELSAEGRIQAAALSGRFAAELAWTSPLRRARETSELMGAAGVRELMELQEIDCGEWTGKTWTEIEANWTDLAARKQHDWLGVAAPGGETWDAVIDRVRRAWDVIREGLKPAAIVGHQGVNAALLYVIAGRDPLVFDQQYGEVIKIDYD
jgi:broad specificity phosphatase PhoE